MATISFHLKRPGSSAPTPILILFNADGQRTKIYTGISVIPQHWNREEQRVKTGKGYPKDNSHINDGLALMSDRLTDYYSKQRATGVVPSPETLRKVIEPVKEEELLTPVTFFACYENWVEICEMSKRANTIRTYRTTLRHLREFEQHTSIVVTFDNLTASFGDQFPAYLIKQRNLKDTAVRKNIAILKTFLNFATDRGFNKSLVYKRFSWKHREPDVLTLTKPELQAIAMLDLTSKPYLENARALFLVGCYTGLRFSDVVALRPEHVHGTTLRLTTTKTDDSLVVPLRPEAQLLVRRMMAGEVHPITNQRLNSYVKELGQLAAIDRPIERVQYQGGKRLPSYAVPKHELLTTHTARRTFVTLALKDGMRDATVRKITGHKSLKSFSRYIEVVEQDIEDEFVSIYGSKPV